MHQSSLPPEEFSESFLTGFRSASVDWWKAWQERQFPDRAFGTAPWQQHVGWLDGLSDTTITALEQKWHVPFPPDFRLFLRHLHAADRPPGATWYDPEGWPKDQRPFFRSFGFYNWILDQERLQVYFDWPLDGLLFHLEHSDLWHPSWGPQPATLEGRKARMTELVHQAPKLIPVLQHRYLLAEPCQAGNPVLSIHRTDMIVYGLNLQDYFRKQFRSVFARSSGKPPATPADALAQIQQIPFWGEFVYA